MNREVFYISEMMEDACHAGSKARMDVEKILSAETFSVLERIEKVEYPSVFKRIRYKANPRYLKKLYNLLGYCGKTCILQYPFYYDRITDRVVKKFAERNQVILIVHDVDSLRGWEGTRSEQEIAFLNRMKVLIVHNRRMAEVLKKLGVRCPMVELELFDYLLPDKVMKATGRKLGKEIAFAGNLYKSKFLQSNEIEKLDMQLNLYGLNFQKEKMGWKNVSYKGSYSSDEIPYKLQGAFGLIWDGESVDTCSGSFGVYMLYNNPHKMSLYISAGLPIIVWKKAAAADFVISHGIGFAVDSLSDISAFIEKLEEADYEEYLMRIKQLQGRVQSGEFVREAVLKALGKL